MDEDNILRVGGRLKNSDLPYNQCHPILLPSYHVFTDLIIRDHHERNLHSGIQSTLYCIRRKFWLMDGRNQVRRVIKNCINCFRAEPSGVQYKMGDLPRVRVTQAGPFLNTGVDYCGPFLVKEKKFRNRVFKKIYVAVFICMSVNAVHLEVVEDMTTDAFIAALDNFISRRGYPQNVYSDNGSNFVGANKELKELYQVFQSETHRNCLQNFVSVRNIQWHFNPPLAPNHGGLWEAAVKTFKHHLKRVMKNFSFTQKEFENLTTKIESILNYRPLFCASSDAND